MQHLSTKGVFQLKNGNWGYRLVTFPQGKRKEERRTQNEDGQPYKTKKQAEVARNNAIINAQIEERRPPQKPVEKKIIEDIYKEYCEKGRAGKAYSTIRKQDSLWKNHIKSRFGKKYIDEVTLAEIQDFLDELYYSDEKAYKYVESFLKMFYLIYGQAYTRNYLDSELYRKMCVNKDTKIHMPKMKIDEDLDIISFNQNEMAALDAYFTGTNAETAYLLGKHCGLRINECYGLKWQNVDPDNGFIVIDRQMQYQEGLIKLVPLKTRNAKRKVYLSCFMQEYLSDLLKKSKRDEENYHEVREQNQTFIRDVDGERISSLELVNSLPNGKIQTVNSMKFHSKVLQHDKKIMFKYHYLRHTYATRVDFQC